MPDVIQHFLASLDAVDIIMRIITSTMGVMYLSYGKKQNFWYFICGLGLLLYPYFIHEKARIITIGIVLLFAPMILTRLIR